MASNHKEIEIRAMLERFWEGETTLSEERSLKEYFAYASVPEDLEHIATYFNTLNIENTDLLDDAFDEEVLSRIGVEPKGGAVVRPLHSAGRYWKMAAAVAVFVGIGSWFIWNQDGLNNMDSDPEVIATNIDQKEVQEAFQETKKALFMLSNNFNRGSEQVKQLGKFEEAQQQVKTISHE